MYFCLSGSTDEDYRKQIKRSSGVSSEGILRNEQIRDFVVSGQRPQFNENFRGKKRELIEKCWDQDPSKRPTFEEVAQSLKDLFITAATAATTEEFQQIF